MAEGEYWDWEVDQCENCERTACKSFFNKNDELPEKLFCVGNIPKPEDPNNTHDLVNKIRFCIKIEEDVEKNEPMILEWTPYEASLVSSFLLMAISNELHKDQPYLDKENNLIHSSSRTPNR